MRRPVAALGILAALSSIATESESQTPAPATPSRNQPFLLVADEVQYDEALGLTIAKGHVEISQDREIILADMVTYNKKTDTLTASGNVSLLDPNGNVLFANYAELQNKLKDAFLKDIRALLQDRSRIAGNTGRWYAGNLLEVRRAVYSPCNLCEEDPSKPPFWQIRAAQAVHDQRAQQIEFRDATLDFAGVPVLYTPYFSLPDPSAGRVSGFLDPTAGHSTTLGFRASTPYYWVIGPDKDVTLTPLLTTEAGGGLGVDYRQRWADAAIDVDTSGAYTNRQSNLTGDTISGIDAFRGSFFAQGEYDINQDWRANMDIQSATDPTYLRRFNFGTGIAAINVSTAPFLISRVDAENFDDRAYTLVDSYAFQSQQSNVGNATQPWVLPEATYNWISHPDSLGSRWSLTGNALNLFRPDGSDMRRVSTGGSWNLPFDGLVGDRFDFTAALRTDGYYSNNFSLTPGGPLVSEFAGRVFPTTRLEWRYPWVRHGAHDSETIEPIVALIASPNGGNPATIPNIDSQEFEFDDTSLFSLDRFPGYDRVDSGQRVDYGLRGGIYGEHGGSTTFLIGQSWRFQNSSVFPAGSGVENRTSDVVGRISLSPGRYLDLIYRFRLGHETLSPQNQEITASAGPSSLRVNLSFISIPEDPNIQGFQALRQITGNVTAELTRYWTVAVFGTQNIGSTTTTAATPTTNPATAAQPSTLGSGIALSFHNECITITGAIARNNTRQADILPGTTVLFTIALKNVGNFDLPVYSTGNTTNVTIPPL